MQLSLVVTLAGLAAGTCEAHVKVTFAGHVMVGGVLSNTVMTWTHVEELPQSSVERYVLFRVYRLTQDWFVVTSTTNTTVGVASQLSDVVTPVMFGAGTCA